VILLVDCGLVDTVVLWFCGSVEDWTADWTWDWTVDNGSVDSGLGLTGTWMDCGTAGWMEL